MDTVGKRIRWLRTQLGMTQLQFSKILRGDVTRGAVGNWERNKGIKRENLQQIADRVDVSFDWLATGRGEKPDPVDLLERGGTLFDQAARMSVARTRKRESERERLHTPGLAIVGEVAAGNWLDLETQDEPRPAPFYVPPDTRFPERFQCAMIVRGKSIERVAKDGDALICVIIGDNSPIEPVNGDIVIAERIRAQGGLIERTAKRLRVRKGLRELVPEYLDETLNRPLPLNETDQDEDIEVRIVGVALGVYSPLRTI